MTDPNRQRHDHIMSSPLPLEPRTLADDPLSGSGWLARELRKVVAEVTPEQRQRVADHPSGFLPAQPEPPASEPGDPIAALDAWWNGERLRRALPGNRQGDLIQIRAYFAKVAKEAQLRLLDIGCPYENPACKCCDPEHLRPQQPEKEGPL